MSTTTPAVRTASQQAPPDQRSSPASQTTLRTAALVGGFGLLAMAVIAVFANFVVVEALVTPGDPATTAADIMASQTLFRLGIVGWVAIAVLDVVVAWALFRFFAPADEGISRLAGWLRLVYGGILLVATSHLTGAVRLLDNGTEQLAAFTVEQLQAQALLHTAAFTDLWDAGLVLFGLHLVALGYLAYRSGYVPKFLGVLLGIGGLGYVVDSVTAVLGQPTNLAVVLFIGEFLLAIWLVVRGRRVVVSGATR
jgi:hypothetical protein